MKMPQKTAATLAVLLLITNGFPVTAGKLPEEPALSDIVSVSGEIPPRKPADQATEYSDEPTSDQLSAFSARIEKSFEGYIAKGSVKELLPDTVSVLPMYSLDEENWQPCPISWCLDYLGDESEGGRRLLHNQICLYSTFEPLKSYLAGSLDRFYLKLHITRENGVTYETQAAVIDRSIPQAVPDGITPAAAFPASIMVIDKSTRPPCCYGRYQLTVRADATSDEVAALLPDTIPIQIHLNEGLSSITEGIINCPIRWKDLSLPQLAAGESVTILDAAEEIVIPSGTLLSTPMGIFRLEEALGIDQYPYTDEIRLVLNVIPAEENPAGALADNYNGLEMAFHLKPTGATNIQAYVLSLGETQWTELPGLPLLQAVDAQPSTPNSGYTLMLSKDSEPYRSYLAAEASGETPTPFFIGLKIEGGIYDGRQLILPYPDTYELPPDLIALGSGGNEGNAGAGNKDDSTTEGQRPNLPQTPEGEEDGPQTDPPKNPADEKNEPQTDPSQNSGNKNEGQGQEPPKEPEDEKKEQLPELPENTENKENEQPSEPLRNPENPSETSNGGNDPFHGGSDYEKPFDEYTPERLDASIQPSAATQPPAMPQTAENNVEEMPLSASSAMDGGTDTSGGIAASDLSPAESETYAASVPVATNEETGSGTKSGEGKLLLSITVAAVTITIAGITGFFLFHSKRIAP